MTALDEAAERVLDWADHQQPWNPAGDFNALYAALNRRPPEGDEPIGPRYYRIGGKRTADCEHPEGAMTSTTDHDVIVCTRCGSRWSNAAIEAEASTSPAREGLRDEWRKHANFTCDCATWAEHESRFLSAPSGGHTWAEHIDCDPSDCTVAAIARDKSQDRRAALSAPDSAPAAALDVPTLAEAMQNVMGIWREMAGGAMADAEKIAAEYARLTDE